MEYQFINIEGVKISYLETKTVSENIIFLIHGNSTSTNAWRKQFKSQTLSSYKLIAFDLPAHGQSNSLNGSLFSYSLPDIGKLMAAAVKKLAGNRSYILAGVSLGTNIIAEMLPYELQPSGIVLTGSCVIGGEITMDKIFLKDIDLHAVFTDYVPESELKKYFTLSSFSVQEEDWLCFSGDYYKVKDNFRSKMIATVAAGKLSNEIYALQQQTFPILIVFGKDEKVCEINYMDNAKLNLWKGKTYKIKEAGHFVIIDQSEKLNELMAEYAKDIFKKDAA
ncbi:MAG TPA: alpha/beta hydrolase [Chitinophagaceae bacterium]|nr:alpha/beta hydrolase [Chitinophagaceae bacterium]